MSNIITLRQLERLEACEEARDKFQELFGDSVEVTIELAKKHASDFPIDWVAQHTLGASARGEYARATASARGEWERARASAWVKWERAAAAARVECDRAAAAAWATEFLKQQSRV